MENLVWKSRTSLQPMKLQNCCSGGFWKIIPVQRAAVLVNGLGATPLEELYILYRRVAQLCAEYGIRVHRAYVGEFATSLEMAGASISVMKLDEELISLLDAPCDSPFFLQTQA